MYRVIKRKNLKVLWIVISLLVATLVLWFVSFYNVNSNAFKQTTEHYKMNEWVKLDGNFFFDAGENTKGYSIRVNSGKLEEYDKLIQKYDKEIDTETDMPKPKYVCLLNITVKNTGNKSGYLNAMGFALFNGALQVPIDFDIWNIIDKNIDGNTLLKLRKNTEVTLTLPFTAQPLDEAVNSHRLNNILENEEFEFYICDFPVRKLIKVKF